MDLFTSLILAGLFFIMGAAVVGMIWYFQGVAHGTIRKGKSATPPESNLEDIAHLMRDMQSQDLVVGINGKTFRAAHELSPGQQRRLNFTSSVLAKWLVETDTPPLPEEEPVTAPLPAEEPASASLLAEESAPASLPAEGSPATPLEAVTQGEEWIPAETFIEEAHPGHIPPFMAEPVEEVKPVSTKLSDMVGGILKPAPIAVPEFKSIAKQINDILQARLAGTQFEARGITVNDAPDRGVMVTLDGEKYQGV
ncbi:MAG: hypothetical protein WAM09_10250 [Anaerolineales bacterium]